jgi:molybdopterin-guanine dinucleotide biosynthesis protein A
MGCLKAEVEIDGTTLAQRAVATLQALTPDVVQVGGERISALDLPHFADRKPGAGPMAGVETALARVEVPLVVLAVDLPFVPPALLTEALRSVERGAEICAPHWDDRWHPLCAAYSPGGLPHLSARLDAGDYSMQALLEDLGTPLPEDVLARLGDPATLLYNINTPEDLERARTLIS